MNAGQQSQVTPEVQGLVSGFIASLEGVPWFKPQENQLSQSWKVYETRAEADKDYSFSNYVPGRELLSQAVRNDIYTMMGNANREELGWDESIHEAVFKYTDGIIVQAALDAVLDPDWESKTDWVEILDAASDIAHLASYDASRSIWLMIGVLSCSDLALPREHLDYANARWSVYLAGCGCIGEINGVLYVYKRP